MLVYKATHGHTLAPCCADTEHRFSEKEDDWGFMAFCALADLKAKKDEFFPDGVLHIKTTMRVELEEKYTGVTRQRTGYVGLKNQVRDTDIVFGGAVCFVHKALASTIFRGAQEHVYLSLALRLGIVPHD